jgi:Tuberculosis necrotizing toxin
MVRDYDTQLLESVAVRRRRLRDAVLFGGLRIRRTLDENLVKVFAGIAIGAVLCAGCVGWSFIQQQRALQKKQQQEQSAGTGGTTASPTPTGRPDWQGKQVTAQMLTNALRKAGVPNGLYVLPGTRAKPGLESYYFVAERSGEFVDGVYERGDERIGARFAGEDQAYRWLYDELVFTDPPPATPAPDDERRDRQLAAEVTGELRQALRANVSSTEYSPRQGLVVDLFGQESGTRLFPEGTPFKQRSLPPSVLTTTDRRYPFNYHRYRIAKPFRVRAGIVPPAFGQPGGGIQLVLDAGFFTERPPLPTVRWLVRNGYLDRLAGN